ncbi:Bug family tripartite tricarboxylate transporter substrate binding protein [Variovorax sp. PBL-E5]|uniref:Bug family tripartite tricarboxylate transporter substrate binding protein n=1 Tax=Variovorax sp. PBL-E5 TaxID=434014 RepID=UPI0013193A58|nr:tripartite tricarboxylate transporter substrate binding protein [Variovorax sp. PBL-E5]VTU37571.1 Argininosuccinate lyase [Variovorax sp. PBL-E5]
MRRLNRFLMSGLVALAMTMGGAAHAEWPHDKPITIIVPFPPGGVTDVLARLVAKELSTSLAQSVIVQNRPGAAGLLGTRVAAQAAPDGYTVLLSQIASHGSLPALHKKLGYDPVRNFEPVILLAAHPNVLVINPTRSPRNVAELISLAKAKPGALNYGSAGIGTTFFLSAELFKSMANVFITGIHYQGGAPAITALLGGQVDIVFSDFSTAMPHVKTGALRALAVTSKTRSPAAPDIPAVAETPGMQDFEVVSWISLHYPAGVPEAIVQRLNAAANKALKAPAVADWVTNSGGMVKGGTPADLARHVDSELAKWKKVIDRTGISTEE